MTEITCCIPNGVNGTNIMALFSWLTQKKTPEQKLLEKFYDMHLTWECKTSDDFIRYQATFQTKGSSAAYIVQGMILIWECFDYYVVRIIYDTVEEPLTLYSKTCEAKSLIEQARTQVDKRGKEAARKAQDKLQARCKNILTLLP